MTRDRQHAGRFRSTPMSGGTSAATATVAQRRRRCRRRVFGKRQAPGEIVLVTVLVLSAVCWPLAIIRRSQDVPNARRVKSRHPSLLAHVSMAIRLTAWLEDICATQLLLGNHWLNDKNRIRDEYRQTGVKLDPEREWEGLYHDNGSCLDITIDTPPGCECYLTILQAREPKL